MKRKRREPEIKWTGPQDATPTRTATIPQCPVCTTQLHNEGRRKAMRRSLVALIQVEEERNRLMTILYAILREHGGEIVVRRTPTEEEVAENTITYKIDDDGALRISLPTNVIVEAGTLIRTVG